MKSEFYLRDRSKIMSFFEKLYHISEEQRNILENEVERYQRDLQIAYIFIGIESALLLILSVVSLTNVLS